MLLDFFIDKSFVADPANAEFEINLLQLKAFLHFFVYLNIRWTNRE